MSSAPIRMHQGHGGQAPLEAVFLTILHTVVSVSQPPVYILIHEGSPSGHPVGNYTNSFAPWWLERIGSLPGASGICSRLLSEEEECEDSTLDGFSFCLSIYFISPEGG